ncbi:MAG: hypothetical protein ACRCU6_03020, partial [Fusobacteriaceae bacterium]
NIFALENRLGIIQNTTELGLNPSPVIVNIPNTPSTNINITLPKPGFFQITLLSGSIAGGLTLTANGIPIVLNTGTIQTENIQGAYKDYYFWTGGVDLVINTGTSNSPAQLAFTPILSAPPLAQSFSGFIFLTGGSSTQVATRGYSYIHLNNPNFTISEGPGIFSPRYNNTVELVDTSFTITNSTGTSQLYYFKLSNHPNGAATSALLDSTIKSEGDPAINRTVIAGVTSTGATKTPVLDSSGRIQVTDPQILTIANRDSLDYPELFTVFGSTNSSYSVKTPTNRYIVKSIFCRNNSGTNLFFQLFNKTSTPALGDIPLLSLLVPANSPLILGSEFFASKGFLLPQVASGTVYAAQSSTEGTYTPLNNNISIHLFGVDRVI